MVIPTPCPKQDGPKPGYLYAAHADGRSGVSETLLEGNHRLWQT